MMPATELSRRPTRQLVPPVPDRAAPIAGQSLDHRGGLLLILLAAFMVVLDFSIVNVALPSIQRELGFPAAAVQWVVTGYAITFAGLLIGGGRAADVFGRRRIFSTGLMVFTAASLAAGLAADPLLLVAARAAQGVGAALVAPAALSLLTTGLPEGPARTRGLGLYGATASIGFVAGQVLGGVLVEYTSWRSVFLVNVPVGIAAVLAAPKLLPESRSTPGAGRARPSARLQLDAGGALLITTAVAAVVFTVSQATVSGWASPAVAAALILAAVAGVAFAVVERHHPDPLVRASLFRWPGLRTGSALIMLLGVWNGGEMLVLSIYFQQVLHESPLMTGLAIAPQGVVGFAAGAFGAQLASRIGMRWWLVLTSCAATAGFLVLTHLPASGGYRPQLAAVTLIGLGTAGVAFGATVTATAGTPNQDQGLIGGVINTSRQIGAAIGAALLPAVAEAANAGTAAGAVGDRAAMLTGAVAAALATILAWPSAASTLALADRLRHLATVGHNEPQLRRHGLTRQFADTTDKPATVLADSELSKDAPSKLTAVPGGEACCSTC